jgi:hypothetical protein
MSAYNSMRSLDLNFQTKLILRYHVSMALYVSFTRLIIILSFMSLIYERKYIVKQKDQRKIF